LLARVIVRPVANYGLPEWLRVTVGLPEENAAFLKAPPGTGRGACMKLALIGVGLIGGSFAAPLRAAGVVGEVIGYDPDPRAVEFAAARDIITRSAASAAEAVRGIDVVVIATPVGATRAADSHCRCADAERDRH
jgi:phosphoglycerate dehydrogenase-like enzyme